MTQHLKPFAEQALQRRSLKYLCAGGDSHLCVPFRLESGERAEVHLILNDDQREAYVLVEVAAISPGMVSAAGRLVLDLNVRFPFVKFNLVENAIFIDVAVELAATSDATVLIGLGFDRLIHAYVETASRVRVALGLEAVPIRELQDFLPSLGL